MMNTELTTELVVFFTDVRGQELTITANATGYYIPAKTWGPMEDCFPPESDLDIYDVWVSQEVAPQKCKVLPWEDIHPRDRVQINILLEDAFWNAYDDYKKGGYTEE